MNLGLDESQQNELYAASVGKQLNEKKWEQLIDFLFFRGPVRVEPVNPETEIHIEDLLPSITLPRRSDPLENVAVLDDFLNFMASNPDILLEKPPFINSLIEKFNKSKNRSEELKYGEIIN